MDLLKGEIAVETRLSFRTLMSINFSAATNFIRDNQIDQEMKDMVRCEEREIKVLPFYDG